MAKIVITGLEEALLEWGIDQAAGHKIGEQIVPVIPTIANALNGGATIAQALLAGAIQYGETQGAAVTNPTLVAVLPIVLAVATAVENGKTPKQALTDALTQLFPEPVAAPASPPAFQPQSWLSAHLGLDKHPQLLDTINSILGSAAATAGADVEGAVAQAAQSGGTTPSVLVDTAIGALKSAGAQIASTDLQTIVGSVIDHAPAFTVDEANAVKSLVNGLIGLVFK